MQSFPASLVTLSPRTALTGSGGNSLQNITPDKLPNYALCQVVGVGLYQLDKNSEATVSAPDCIATIRGASVPGRWILVDTGAATDGWTDLGVFALTSGDTTVAQIPAPEEGYSQIIEVDGLYQPVEATAGQYFRVVGVVAIQSSPMQLLIDTGAFGAFDLQVRLGTLSAGNYPLIALVTTAGPENLRLRWRTAGLIVNSDPNPP